VLSPLGFAFVMLAFTREDASVVAPVLGLKVLFLAVLESIINSHPVSLGVILGAVLSVAGLTLMSQNDKWSLHGKDLLRPGILFMGIAALSFAICDIFLRHAVVFWTSHLAFTFYTVVLLAVVSSVILIIIPLAQRVAHRRRQHIQGITFTPAAPRVSWQQCLDAGWPLVISATASTTSQYFLFTSFAIGKQVTLSNIVYNTRSLFVIAIMAALVLGQGNTIERAGKHAYLYRFSGVLLILAATACALVM
jgi:drug/metabolite transporter (DMT)-like permease